MSAGRVDWPLVVGLIAFCAATLATALTLTGNAATGGVAAILSLGLAALGRAMRHRDEALSVTAPFDWDAFDAARAAWSMHGHGRSGRGSSSWWPEA